MFQTLYQIASPVRSLTILRAIGALSAKEEKIVTDQVRSQCLGNDGARPERLRRTSTDTTAMKEILLVEWRGLFAPRILHARGTGTQTMKTETRITVRPMQTRQDASGIVEMARELALALHDPRPPITAEVLLRDGLGPDRWFDCWVAENKLELAGYALACRSFEAHTGKKRLWLGDLYVRPATRLQGVGRLLFAAVARRAIALGCDAVYWELWKQNARGAAFYRQLHAQEVGELVIMCLDGKVLARIADDA